MEKIYAGEMQLQCQRDANATPHVNNKTEPVR